MLKHYHGQLVYVEETVSASPTRMRPTLCRVLILETYSRVLVRAADLEA